MKDMFEFPVAAVMPGNLFANILSTSGIVNPDIDSGEFED